MKWVPLWTFGIVSGVVIGAALVAKPGENSALFLSATLVCAFWVAVLIYVGRFWKPKR